MNALSIYVIVSAGLLAWVASLWSTSGALNMLIKTAFVGGAVFGAIMAAKLIV